MNPMARKTIAPTTTRETAGSRLQKMNLVRKLHQPFVVDKLHATDWNQGTDAPLIVELDTTEACDLACPNCISEDILQNGNRFSTERLMALGAEMVEAGVKGVILIGGGEPLAHPAVGQLMEYLGTHDVHIGITTNGTMIDRYLDVIAEYASWTRVSMDAATADTFGILRPSRGGRSRFDHIVDNMRRLARVKKGKLGYSFLIQTPMDGPGVVSNIHEIYDAAKLARDIGCDYFEVKPSYQYRDGVDHALVIHDRKLMAQARREIERLEELETEHFKVLKAINLDASLDGCQHDQPKDYHWCPAAELRTLICPSGAYVCPYWRGKAHMKIGDPASVPLRELWRGEIRRKVMKRLDPAVDCRFHCLRHESNLETIRMIDQIRAGRPIEVVKEYDRFI